MLISTVGQCSDLRECQIESIVAVAGESIRPYLSYLLGLTDLIGRT
jgi:hypothetical protein